MSAIKINSKRFNRKFEAEIFQRPNERSTDCVFIISHTSLKNIFYKQLTDADFLQERTEILQTTAADIRDCADLLRCVDCENVCSIGKEQKIKENENQFTRIESLI